MDQKQRKAGTNPVAAVLKSNTGHIETIWQQKQITQNAVKYAETLAIDD